METIWENITSTLKLSPELSAKWLANLRAQYSESHRHYHTEHELLRRKVPVIMGRSVCFQLAALFQYYHFEANKDCMVQNCNVATEFFTDINLGNKVLEANVKRLLGDLQSDVCDLSESDFHFFQDLDLLVLGTTTEEYKQYTEQLREECTLEDMQSYDKNRLKLLKTISRIPHIYLTNTFGEQYERVARENIEQEIKELEARH